MGDNLSFWIRDDHLNLGGKPWLCICIWFFCAIWMSFIIVIWWDDESQTTGRSAEDKECSADEAAKDSGGGNSEVAFSAMKMSSEIWWWKKLWTSVFFFGCCWKTCAFFSFFFKHVETPKHILFTFLLFELGWGCWKNLPHSHKKVSPNVSVNFGCDFRWGKPRIIFTPSFLVDIFWGWDDEKFPRILSALIQVEKSECTCRQPARWVCGGSVEVVLGHSWRKALMVCLMGNTFHSPRN